MNGKRIPENHHFTDNMPNLIDQLDLPRCPLCNVDRPNLNAVFRHSTTNYDGDRKRYWNAYQCARCGGLVVAWSPFDRGEIYEILPALTQVDNTIPEPAKTYLQQAIESQHAPSGAIMLAASSVDSMLKNKGYKEGVLKSRIDKAAEDHLITEGMAKWAHNIRLDANEQRHADEAAPLPDEEDARHSIEFAIALGEFLFVLPSRVNKGLKEAVDPKPEESK